MWQTEQWRVSASRTKQLCFAYGSNDGAWRWDKKRDTCSQSHKVVKARGVKVSQSVPAESLPFSITHQPLVTIQWPKAQQLPGSLRQWGWHTSGGFLSPFPEGQWGNPRGRCRSGPGSSVQSKWKGSRDLVTHSIHMTMMGKQRVSGCCLYWTNTFCPYSKEPCCVKING